MTTTKENKPSKKTLKTKNIGEKKAPKEEKDDRKTFISKRVDEYTQNAKVILSEEILRVTSEFYLQISSSSEKVNLDHILNYRLSKPLEVSNALKNSLLQLQRRARILRNRGECLNFLNKTDQEAIDLLLEDPSNTIIAVMVAQKIALYKRFDPPFILEAESLTQELAHTLRGNGVTKKALEKILTQGEQTLPLERSYDIEVYGYADKRKIWVGYKGKLEIMSPSSLETHLGVLIGEHKESPIVQVLALNTLEESAKKGPISDKDPIGQGIYLLENHWLISSGMNAVSIHRKTLEKKKLNAPVFESKKMSLDGKSWVNLEEVNPEHFEGTLGSVFRELEQIVALWEWEDKSQVPYITASLMLVLFQQAIDWRPILYISGAQGTGKTIFAELMQLLFSGFCEVVDKTTAHAMKQTFGHDSKPGFLDEFEHYSSEKHQRDVLNLLKTSCRGGIASSGKIFGGKPRRYRLSHMFFLASISFPKCIETDQALKDRIIIFNLKKKKDKFLTLPSKPVLEELGVKIIDAMIKNWDALEKAVTKIKDPDFIRGQMKSHASSARDIDNFMWMSALLSTVNEKEEIGRVVPSFVKKSESNNIDEILYHILTKRIGSSTAEANASFLYDFIYQSFDLKGEGETRHVNQSKAKEELRKNYCTVIKKKNGQKYFAIQSKHADFLLDRNSSFAGLDIKTILGRDERVIFETVRYGNVTIRSMLIPMKYVDKILGNEDLEDS